MPRELAFDVLGDVLIRKRQFDDVFARHPRLDDLDGRDRALAYNLIATTIRRLGQIDGLINHCLDKKMPPKARDAKTVLRLGVCQLMFLDIPAHAAVSTSVDLAEHRKLGPYKKLINAVLRRIGREGENLIKDQDAARLNTPDWLWETWSTAYGADLCRNIAAAHLVAPPLDITVSADRELWAEKMHGNILPTGSLRLNKAPPVSTLPGYNQGTWWVQDAAAALPARLLGDVKEKAIADICAAPGGKTAQLAAGGAKVIALDRSEKRLKTMAENLNRLSLQVKTVCIDAASWRPDSPLDGVLLDAPCSATGTIRRHPDVAWSKKPGEVDKAQQTQFRLLRAAADMVRPGGTVIYATCSLQPEEGPQIVASFLKENPNWRRRAIEPEEINGLNDLISDDGDLRTLPCHLSELGGMDGFFAARLVKE